MEMFSNDFFAKIPPNAHKTLPMVCVCMLPREQRAGRAWCVGTLDFIIRNVTLMTSLLRFGKLQYCMPPQQSRRTRTKINDDSSDDNHATARKNRVNAFLVGHEKNACER
jgi:hypothetical protein